MSGDNVLLQTVILLLGLVFILGADSNKPHAHQGLLQPYDGKLLNMIDFTASQQTKLNNGEAVRSYSIIISCSG